MCFRRRLSGGVEGMRVLPGQVSAPSSSDKGALALIRIRRRLLNYDTIP